MPDKIQTPVPGSGRIARRWLTLFYLLPVMFVAGLIISMAYNFATHRPPPVRKTSLSPFASLKIDGLTANLFAQGNALRASGNDLLLEFRDPQGKLADVGDVLLEMALKAPGSITHITTKPRRTSTPGQYRTPLNPSLVGDWTATLSFDGPRGKAEASLTVKVM